MQDIARTSAERIAGLRSVIAKIDEHDSLDGLSLLQAADKKLEQAAINLSIVGQVKAGKSTLINALTEIGDLLPTEVNPWTAVITNLHFGKPLRAPGTAQFTMFSEEEWERMVQGDTETRRLAEEYLPGFDTETLQEQVKEMQDRARAQLGGMYQHLLGKVHSFSKVNREVLDRYVCAGDSIARDGTANGPGKLSSITKSADIYLDAGPFCLPMTVADTPGINDPFLVRDEITTNYIKTADMSVVAISAHQPLNSADIALLKMLSRTEGKKVMVFVNRCDELGAAIAEVPKILDSLRERLAEEVPDAAFALCAGSAFWGHIATQGSNAEVAEALDTPAFKALVATGALRPDGSDRERLMEASGLNELRAELSKTILDGPVSKLIADVAGQVVVAIDLVRNQIEMQIKQETDILEGEPSLIRQEAIETLQARQQRMDGVKEDISAIIMHHMPQLDVSAEAAAVGPYMREVVEYYIAEQCERLRAAIARGAAEGTWTFDYKRMRSIVDERMLAHYRNGRDKIDNRVADFALALNGAIAPLFGALQFGALAETLPASDLLPGFKPQSELVEIDLTRNRGWRFWQSRKLNPDEAMQAVAGLVRAEIRAAADETARVLSEGFLRRSLAAKEVFAGVQQTLERLMQREIAAIQADINRITSGNGGDELDRMIAQRGERLAGLKDDLNGLNGLYSELSAFSTQRPAQVITAA